MEELRILNKNWKTMLKEHGHQQLRMTETIHGVGRGSKMEHGHEQLCMIKTIHVVKTPMVTDGLVFLFSSG